ncbi:MAG: hypothetical protein ABS36_18670 [Acidobacteria bacterium SCN 69-37]|nr:MAG: hypothetical protein ABS36_18670 [Acidobacteria bacterium SCN 69-37]
MSLRLPLFSIAAWLAAALVFSGPVAAIAQTFTLPARDFSGTVSVSKSLVLPGDELDLVGARFVPGQRVVLSNGLDRLTPEPVAVGADGAFRVHLRLPASVAVGIHPIVVSASQPTAAQIVNLKVSPSLPLTGSDRFDVVRVSPVGTNYHHLYQAAHSAKHDTLFVTQAVGRPPVKVSGLLKFDARTLTLQHRITPAPAPGDTSGGLLAVYGVAVDDAHDTVWVTNSRQGTVAVYRQSDLALVKQFPTDLVPHARDIIVDADRSRAYASATGSNVIAVFDTGTLARIGTIEIKSARWGGTFVPTSLELDRAAGKLFTVSLETPEAVIIDVTRQTIDRVIAVPHVQSAIGVAYDARTRRLFVAAQGTDNLVIVDTMTGDVVKDVPIGSGAINVAFDPIERLAYVVNRTGGTVAVVDPDGAVVANIRTGTAPNHVHEDGRGSVYVVTMNEGGDHITRLTPRKR